MLKLCPECGLQVSDRAVSCPHCGYPLRSSSQSAKRRHIRLPNGFGQITELKNKNLRNPFRVMVTVGKTEYGKPICKLLKPQAYFKTYNDAYAALVEYNKAPYELSSEMTIAELYEQWSEKYFETIAPSSTRTIKSAWNCCTPVADMRVRDVRVRHIKLCMEQAPSQNVANRVKSLFNLMLDYAVEYELADKNYARDFNVETAEAQTEHEAFTDEELTKLWEYQSVPYACYVLLQCYMGWRPQEIGLLKKENIDWNKNIIVGGMKTDAGTNRVVPIHKSIIPLVKKLEQLSNSLGSEYLCPSLDGTQMTYDKYRHRFHRVMGEIGIDERHRPHDPRKTFITLAKKAEVNEYAIKYIVGHAISDLTEKVYTERDPEWLNKEVNKISTSYPPQSR